MEREKEVRDVDESDEILLSLPLLGSPLLGLDQDEQSSWRSAENAFTNRRGKYKISIKIYSILFKNKSTIEAKI